MCRHSWIHDFAISRLSSLQININCQRLKYEKQFAMTARLIWLDFDHPPRVHTRIIQECTQLVVGVNQSYGTKQKNYVLSN